MTVVMTTPIILTLCFLFAGVLHLRTVLPPYPSDPPGHG